MEIRRCIGCMSDLGEEKGRFCPYCGYDNDADNLKPLCAMRPNTILHERYLVGRALGQGNLGITYIGFDLALNEKVVLKEYFPPGFGGQGGRTLEYAALEFLQIIPNRDGGLAKAFCARRARRPKWTRFPPLSGSGTRFTRMKRPIS